MKTQPMILIVVLLTVVALLTIPLIGKANLNSKVKKDVKRLFSNSKDNSSKMFSNSQLNELPEPVQRYFRYALTEGQAYINCVRLKHDGQFKTAPGKNWVDIEGEQYFTADVPGFFWKGKTSMFTARDMYIEGKGRLAVSLFSLFKIVDEQGSHVDQAELLRWLGESVWFPTNLLPGDNLQWTAIDSAKAKITFEHNGITVYYIVHFNETGQIIKLETERYMEQDRKEKWEGIVSDYKEINGMKVPTFIEAKWKLDEGTHSYARFYIQKIEYDIPEKF
jgi:hypothetical protein